MNLTNDEVLELAKEAGFHIDNKEIKVFPSQYHSVSNCGITESLNAFATAITEKLQEKSQGQAIYQLNSLGQWTDIPKETYVTISPIHTRIVYLNPASEQPQTINNYDAFRDWLFRVLDHAADYEESINLTEAKSRIDLHLTEKLRALIDQPAEQPAQSQELTDAQIIKAAYQARIIDANHDWVGRLEANTMIHLRHFVDMLALQSKPAKG